MIQARLLAVPYLVLYPSDPYTIPEIGAYWADTQSPQMSGAECVIHLCLINYLHIAIYWILLYAVPSITFCFVHQSTLN